MSPADEEVDIVDPDDRVVGRATRAEMRRANLRHRCVWILVLDGAGALFVHQRTATKDVYPAYWDVAAGGVVAAGEDYATAARRELAEELGIDVEPVEVGSVRFEDAATKVVGRVFVATFQGEPRLQASEVARGEWLPLAEITEALRQRRFCPDGSAALAAALLHNDLGAGAALRADLLANLRPGPDVTHDDAAGAADQRWMARALELARVAAASGEVPVGAVVVAGDRVIGEGHNAPISSCDPTAHAEVVALRAAARSTGNYRLTGTTLYVTVEPCLMCVGALVAARIERVVFGCSEPKSGALGSVFDAQQGVRLNHRFAVRGGVCADEARLLVQNFFRARRGA